MVSLHIGSTGQLWLAWDLEPSIFIGLALAAWLYARGLHLSTGSRRRLHPWWRPTLFYLGLAVTFIALVSPLDHMANELFSMHMIQHLLLMVVAPPLILLGAPIIPLLRGVPRPVRRLVVGPLIRQPVIRGGLRFLSMPLVAWPLYIATLLAWHIPAAYDLALRDENVHTLEHLNFLVAATLFWWNVIDPIPLRSHLSYLVRVPFVFITTVPNFILGAFLTFSQEAWYAHYRARELPFGMSARDDQQLGGVLMWVPGSLILLGTLLIVLVYVVVAEEQRQFQRETGKAEP
jgi:putative membrane protein